MGIRVHKVMGYGLTDVKFEKKNYRPADPRINPEGVFCDFETQYDIKDYMAFLKKEAKRGDNAWDAAFELAALRDQRKRKKHIDPQRAFVYDGEYGLGNVLMVVPLSCYSSWFRYDDPLDYAEESHRGRTTKDYQCINHVTEIYGGFHPWDNQFWDKRNFKKAPWSLIEQKYNKKFFTEEELSNLAQMHGWEDWKDFEDNAVPIVPDCVRLLCEWGKAFTSSDVWTQLKPMIYVYWS